MIALLLIFLLLVVAGPAAEPAEAHHRCGHGNVTCPPPSDTRLNPLTLFAPVGVHETSVDLDWSSEPTGTRSSYRVYFRPGLSGSPESSQTFTTSAGTVTGLLSNTAYAFEATATFSDGAETRRSNTVSTTTGGAVPPPTGCSPAFGSFGIGNWPPACWRPFTASSPINKLIPANPKLHSDSAAIVNRVLTMGAVTKHIVGDLDPIYDYGAPLYWSKPTDPLFTTSFIESWCCFSTGWGIGGKNLEGKAVRIPSAARWAGQGAGQGNPDAHMTTVDQSANREYDFYEVSRKDTGQLVSRWGGSCDVVNGTGFSVHDAPKGEGCEATAWGGARLAGVMRAQEMIAGTINHAMYAVVDCSNGAWVYPANHPARSCSSIGKSNTYAPPTGARFYLAYSDAEIAAAPWPPWKKAWVRAWAHYGLYVGDTGGGGFTPLQLESPETYRSFGYQDPLVAYAQACGCASHWYNGDPYFALDGIDWAGRLKLLDWNDPANR